MIYTERKNCRICDGEFEIVLDLGNIAVNDFVDNEQDVVYSPLTLVRCKKCSLVQLKHTTNQDKLYSYYWYLSGINKSMIDSLQDVVDNIEKRIVLEDGDTVIDIGCNDGTMLGQYHNKKLYRIGFDPAQNLAEQAKKNCEVFHNTYFGTPDILVPKAKAITSIAMFYDLEDPRNFIERIKEALRKDGIWVVQFTDLQSMFKINAYDNITHEHLEYYSFGVLKTLMEDHGLEIIDVSTNNVNGHSVRMYVGWKNEYIVQDSVVQHLNAERAYMEQFDNPFKAFADRCETLRVETRKFITDKILEGKTIAAMGASSKGNTLLQYLGLSNKVISYAGEVSPEKFGRKTVATNIPIIPELEAIDRKPDYFLVLPWHFKNVLVEKHRAYLGNGGHFIIPCPELEII